MQKLYSENMEKALLGCMIINNEIIDDVQAKIKKEYFNIGKNSLIYENVVRLYNANNSCDLIMLSQALPQFAKDIADLTTDCASAANYEYYMDSIRKYYIARRYNQFMADKSSNLSLTTIDDILYDTDDFINGCMTNVDNIEPTNGKQMAMSIIEDIQAISKRHGELEGFDTGYSQLNEMLGGLQTGNLITIGARPSIGKSTFADQLNVNLALNKVKTCTFSLEMTKKEIQRRRVSCLANVPLKNIKSGLLSASHIARINQACSRIFDLDTLLYDSSQIGFDFNEIVARIRIHAKQGYKVFFIDHIGLLEYNEGSGLKEYEKISQMTKRLKKLAATLDVAIVIVCQLTRDSEGNEPQLNSLRGSGSIEQDSNIVMFLHRERQHSNEISIPTRLIVAKNRDGSCGDIHFEFIPDMTKFNELDNEGNPVKKMPVAVKVEKKEPPKDNYDNYSDYNEEMSEEQALF